VAISHWILLRMQNVSDKSCRGNKNTHSTFNNFFSENSIFCGMTWKIAVQFDKAVDHNITRRTHFAFRITKATKTYSEYLIILVLPRQQCLRELILVSRLCLYCLFCSGLLQKRLVLLRNFRNAMSPKVRGRLELQVLVADVN